MTKRQKEARAFAQGRCSGGIDNSELLLRARCCGQCLLTRKRIVPGKRAAEIIRECRAEDKHFVCHKAPEGVVVHCRGMHDRYGSRAARFAKAFGIPVVEVDTDRAGAL